MPDIAKHVTVDLAQRKLYVNGERFPFHIVEGGIRVDGLAAEAGGLATVTVTFFADDIEVVPAGPTPAAREEAQALLRETGKALLTLLGLDEAAVDRILGPLWDDLELAAASWGVMADASQPVTRES
ncbi:hypothetical protein [Nocardia farcinica]|uniref:Uncharacterized protein n=1 Tax=Nocardia farcinica (strain IFM 10152) TaxID=247156 RepID=Q5Z3W4_NOCFA|nr:hypothetical protein [Nocardia farcinica]BAD54877.1 hypothetical protein NFA_350 [Nocardia farcinica IFM 10152]